ncbi:hypothetical protein R1flu_009048 [Riccia fluitans]|uniref:Integrase zinc-binding domain-containing protein n=1 Tax=Riccia fluitans TaxID=41844 RepID=A0ABD1Z1F8_9MARC
MKTSLELMRMCTLPQGASNSMAHMMSGMNKVLRDFIPEKTMPFLDDVPIKGCREEDKDDTMDQRGCKRYVAEHIEGCEKILSRLEEAHLTLFGAKSTFGVWEVVIIGHLCGSFGRKPNPAKIDIIVHIKEVCNSLTDVRRFLGACIFYHIWIPHYAHIAEPLYALCQKGQRFRWENEHVQAMQKLKALLSSTPVLGRIDYKCRRPVILIVDTSPIAIGWVKRELWGVVTTMKAKKEYLMGASVVVETDCLPILGMIINCSTPNMTMLNWIAYIKSLNPEFKHIAGKENVIADMLSRARQEGWANEEFRRIQRKAYNYMLKDGYLWKRTKRRDGLPQRVVYDKEIRLELMKQLHESLWAGHRDIWATFAKLKERYWWKNMNRDVVAFVESCMTCQMYSNIRHRDRLHPMYPLAIHFKWVVDLVTMPIELWQMSYLVLAREDLSNQVEGRALRVALERLKVAHVKNKERFDARHKLRPRDIKEGEWVLVYNSSLVNQHSALYKFSKCWFDPYVVVRINDNATYVLRELDGTQLRIPIARKRVKIFKQRDGQLDDLDGVDPDGSHGRGIQMMKRKEMANYLSKKIAVIKEPVHSVFFSYAYHDCVRLEGVDVVSWTG